MRLIPLSLSVSVFYLCLSVAPSVVVSAAQATPVDVSKLGPQVGQAAPPFEGLASAAGAKGTMLVFFRSADW